MDEARPSESIHSPGTARKPQSRARGMRGHRCAAGVVRRRWHARRRGILLQDAHLADRASLVSRKDSPAAARAPDRLLTTGCRQEAPIASAGNAGASMRCRSGSPAVACSPPGDFATGCPLGRQGVARESQRFPGGCACPRPAPHDRERVRACLPVRKPKRKRGEYARHPDPFHATTPGTTSPPAKTRRNPQCLLQFP